MDTSLYNHRAYTGVAIPPLSFNKCKSKHAKYVGFSFSLLHNNFKSLKLNLENFQNRLLDDLDYEIGLIEVSETKLNRSKDVDFDPGISGYAFEYAPTLLPSGCVGLY